MDYFLAVLTTVNPSNVGDAVKKDTMPGVALGAGEEIRETRHPRRYWSCVRGCRSNGQQKNDIHILPVCTTNTYSITAVIECSSSVSSSQPSKQLSVSLLLDTGAAVSLLRKDKWDLIASPDLPLNRWNGPKLTGVEGSPLNVFGCSPIWIRLSGEVFQWTMLIVDQLTTEGILGLDFLEANSCSVNMANRCIHFPDRKLSFPLYAISSTANQSVLPIRVVLRETIQIPARSQMEIVGVPQEPVIGGAWIFDRPKTEV